jgi:hypothetical protein
MKGRDGFIVDQAHWFRGAARLAAGAASATVIHMHSLRQLQCRNLVRPRLAQPNIADPVTPHYRLVAHAIAIAWRIGVFQSTTIRFTFDNGTAGERGGAPREQVLHQNISAHGNWVFGRKPFDCAKARSFSSARGARDRWCTMRDEFASKSFLAAAVAGLVLLCSGLVAFAFN